ncbi:MAG: anaerobic carbon-monoxide dehydrogenase catalytic subunit [Chloroflexi bacterium]|nr:anaerobic carbon-monoxide dehydrogenase catalytic subunit [Chloroflexota bacterium]
MPDKKTIDPAAAEVLERAQQLGLSSAFSRADATKPCPIGQEGNCCSVCFMGPCRFVGKTTAGICGASKETIQARNLARKIAAGGAAHSDHGRDMAFALLLTARGEAQGFEIKDEKKLEKVARLMGIDTAGRTKEKVAEEVALRAIRDFGQQEGELTYIKRAPKKRQEIWRKLGIVPRGVDREVVETLHRTGMGTDQDAEHILDHAMRTALADGWGGSMLATDIGDILFGTPAPAVTSMNLGVLKEDEVNIVVHGHHPTLSETIVQASKDPAIIEYAKSKGAKGINLAGICCTANEVLMRQGVPLAGNMLHQELAIMTGAVEAMVVDVQCVMEALVEVASHFHTKVITTSPKAKITGATHIEFEETRGLDIARLILRTAIDNYPNRKEAHIPDVSSPVVIGFSHEYLNYMQGGRFRESFRPLNDAVIAGRIRGAAAVVGCNNPRAVQDEGIMTVIKELIANDVVVVATGCGAAAAGKHGYLTPEVFQAAGPGLKEVCQAIGVPPVLHMGSCVDNSRILTVLTQMANEGGLGDDISDIPAVGICPEWMNEKALCIAAYAVASGCYVLFGVGSPVAGSPEVTRLISEGWEKKVGGKLEFEVDPHKIVEKALAHIDKKRVALKLAEYDPKKFAQSETYLPADYAKDPKVYTEGHRTKAGVV